MEEKKFDEQVKEYIKQVCESGRYDVKFDEFDIDVSFDVSLHRETGSIDGYEIRFKREDAWDLTYKTKLTEKHGKFEHSIYSSADPKYVAAYAVIGYAESKERYEENQQKKREEEIKKEFNKQFSLFKRLFGG